MMKGMRIQLKRLEERGGPGSGKQFILSIFVNSHNNRYSCHPAECSTVIYVYYTGFKT
jgi:hypothetical protein